MATVNMHEAKTNLSKLVEAVENGSEGEVIISRNGKPAARLVPLAAAPATARKARRVGIAEGTFSFDYETFRALDAEIAREFYEKPLFKTPADMDAWYASRRSGAKKKSA